MSAQTETDQRYTVEMFDTPHHPQWKRGTVLAQEKLKLPQREAIHHTLMNSDGSEVVFFSNDHCFGVNILPDSWVPCSIRLPWNYKPRPGLEEGVARTAADVQKFLQHCNPDTTFLYSIEELVEYLNTHT